VKGVFLYYFDYWHVYVWFCNNISFYFLQAAQNGFWVVFEDFDKAPSDVQSILLPLLEGLSSFSNGHGEVISFYSVLKSLEKIACSTSVLTLTL
jgi:hypothetical protein